MAVVTDLEYALENRLIKRLDKFCDRVSRPNSIQDVLFTLHGSTGTGKTNASLCLAYYFKYKLKRNIHLFFRTSKAIDFIKNSSEGIIIIDEPGLDSLSKDHATSLNKDFLRLIFTMRMKRHIVIVNIARFWRFPYDVVVDRALAMINVWNRNGKSPGRFQYIRKNKLDKLWREHERTGRLLFGELKSFGGQFPERMEKIDKNTGKKYFDLMGININEKNSCTYEDYKEFREKEVATIGEIKISKRELQINAKVLELKKRILVATAKLGLNKSEMGRALGLDPKVLTDWQNIGSMTAFSLENHDFRPSTESSINSFMGNPRTGIKNEPKP